ncbi:MAG: hypothetical protein Q7S27_06765 [Nanoarchaeota archaeon]|nr:hypothetical protein [Nanoarchaeota archaeon]
MAIFLLERKKTLNILNCTEIFGLTKSGKTTYLRQRVKKGEQVLFVEKGKFFSKVVNFLKYASKNPTNVLYLFFRLNSNWIYLKELTLKDYLVIWKMRNYYLAAVLSKYEKLKWSKENYFVDEFLLQSLFMIFQVKSSEENIKKIISRIPKSKNVLIIEAPPKIRYSRISNVKNPATKLSSEYKLKWVKNSEYNYETIKKILLEEYRQIK